jgi:hypothetical protein
MWPTCESSVTGLLGKRVSSTAIGAWGASYSGGLILNALASGVPLAAAAVPETWTDLYAALLAAGRCRDVPGRWLDGRVPTRAESRS